METYKQLKERHQREASAFPMFFAFNQEQFEEGMTKLGVTDKSELLSVGFGGFMKKESRQAYFEMVNRQVSELTESMKNHDFAVQGFRYEMENIEYYLNQDREQLLSYFGLTENNLVSDPNLQSAYVQARQDYFDYADKQYSGVW